MAFLNLSLYCFLNNPLHRTTDIRFLKELVLICSFIVFIEIVLSLLMCSIFLFIHYGIKKALCLNYPYSSPKRICCDLFIRGLVSLF